VKLEKKEGAKGKKEVVRNFWVIEENAQIKLRVGQN